MSLNETYLIADCGHSVTTVALFKVVAGNYRLISRAQATSTITDPVPDVLLGIEAAIREIENTTGHAILVGDGDLIRNTAQAGRGIDHFSLTASASTPVRLAIVAPHVNDESIDSIQRLIREVSTERVEVFAKDDGRNLQMRIDDLGELRPDLIIITHGPNKRVTSELTMLCEAVRFGQKQLDPSDRAKIIYCGHADGEEPVSAALTKEFPLIATEHARPKGRKEMLGPLRQTVREQLQEIKLRQIPGMAGVIGWGGEVPTATVDALVDVVQYRTSVREGNVLLIDLEHDDLILIFANQEETHVVTRPEFGMGKPLANLLDYIDADQFFRWLPQEIEDRDALEARFQAYLINQSLYPNMIPMVAEEFRFLQAIMRAVVAKAWEEARTMWGVPDSLALDLQTIIVRGRPLMMMPRSSQIIHLILDAIQPFGVASVVLDRYGVLPAVGKLAEQNPIAAVQTAESGVLLDLGWTVGVKGWQGNGRAVKLDLKSDQIGKLEIDVNWGSIEVLPVPRTMSGDLTINPHFLAHIGNGRGRKKVLEGVGGGLVGVVVDARGRPLNLPKNEQKRSEMLEKWIADIGG